MAGAFVALSTLCAKTVGVAENAISPVQVTFGRFAFGLLGLMVALPFIRPVFSNPNWGLHAGRVTCGVTGVMAMFTAATIIPLVDATAISFTNPIFAMLLAIPLLHERIGPIRWGTAFMALLGALLLIRPGTSSFQPSALIALYAALAFGLEVVLLKKLSVREGAFQIILIANIAGTIVAGLVSIAIWVQPTAFQWMLLAATGLTMVCAQACYTTALRLADASFVLPFSYATLLFAALYDYAFFGVIPIAASLLGGGLILVSGIILGWREGRAKRMAT